MGTNAFTFTFTERELSLLAEAAEYAGWALATNTTVFTREDFMAMAARLDERLNY